MVKCALFWGCVELSPKWSRLCLSSWGWIIRFCRSTFFFVSRRKRATIKNDQNRHSSSGMMEILNKKYIQMMFWCKVKLLIRCFLFIAFFLHIATRPLDRLLHHLQRIWRAQNCHQIESRPKCWPVRRQGFCIFTGCERRSEADSLQRWSHEDEIGRQWERDWQEEL